MQPVGTVPGTWHQGQGLGRPKRALQGCAVLQDPEHLFETISQAMLNAVDRDAVSGMGVIVHVM